MSLGKNDSTASEKKSAAALPPKPKSTPQDQQPGFGPTTDSQKTKSGKRAELVKFKFDKDDVKLRELEAVETSKKGKKQDNKPFDQFKDKPTTYKEEIYL